MDFRHDVRLRRVAEPGCYQAELDDRWWIVTGPNGGLLAALLLRAVQTDVGERRRDVAARILTVQYLSGPQLGPVRIEVTVDKDGRRVCFASAVMTQGSRVICQAKVTLVAELGDDFDLSDHTMPAAPPPAECPILDPHATYGNARKRWQRRHVEGGPPGVVAGWMRLEPPVPIDAAVLALMCDNLPPSLRGHVADPVLAERTHTTTIELTVYFRRAEPALSPDDECLVLLRSASVVDGLHQEEGEVWSPDGRLLATSRQLALVFLRPETSTSSSDS